MAKPKRRQDDKAQSERFKEKARELKADETSKAFENAFKKIVPSSKQRPSPRPRRKES